MAIIIAVTSLIGGGNSHLADSPYVGTWNAYSAVALGQEMSLDTVFPAGVALILEANGDCTLTVEAATDKGSWDINESGLGLAITIGGTTMPATVANNILTLANVQGTGTDINFVMQGMPVPSLAPAASPTTGLAAEQYWYGVLQVSNYSGPNTMPEKMDIWGHLKGDYPYFELFDAEGADYAIFSAYVDLTDTGFATLAADGDAWIFEKTLDVEEEVYFSPTLDNGALKMEYHYDYNGESFDIMIFVREDGAPWDEQSDPLPPGYEEYKAEIGGATL